MTSVTQSIPEKNALLVEYPGYVKDSDAAIQTLGGLEAISATADGSSPVMSLHLRPGDPLSHPLSGYKQSTRGLLLRISRNAGAATDSEEELKAEVMAHVKFAVRFPGLADFQYVSCDPRPLHEQVAQQEGPPGLETEPMLFPPPLFTKQDLPMDYAFRSYYGADPDYMKTGVSSLGRGIGRLAAHVINFQAVNVLAPLSDPGAEGAGLYKDRKLVLKDFSELMAERPIWSSAALKERVESSFTDVEFDIMLPRIAYMFRNGPWRGLWVRRGYDPRSDPTSHKYQAVDYRGVERSAAEASGSSGPSYKDVTSFAAIPVGECILQLCNLADDYIQSVIDKPAQLETCSLKSGWFSLEVWHELRERVESRFAALCQAATPSRGSAEAIGATQPAAAGQPGAGTNQQDSAGASSAATEQPQPNPDAPQQDASMSERGGKPDVPPVHFPRESTQRAGNAGAGLAAAAEPPQPAGADVSAAGDFSMADDVSGVAEGAGPPGAAHDILPAVYLQSVLDSWQAEGPPPVAPSAAELLAASGGDAGDFEIYEGSDEEGEEADAADDDAGLTEEAQTNDEAEDSDESADDRGQAAAGGDDAEGALGKGETEGEEEESEESEEEESEMEDEDMEEAYNEDDDVG
ncbi:hypothetical protein COCSUDRAFT_57748 [Coccomyxa subellipsoidea C-169]|uniref:Transcription factor IIIC subunit 5 HTH domain-containing protein n=1 Tax=Coccomyxa subellipsoidea (strain C-169) TaxID=574566 RepID=I0YQD5_COCSC|nr:hypothetical protein COCSUDRAFT_57748 [Coccomyxa subellipsoidea C-169]EIE20604.1 hypothetical protein COCSUDRAFT_57748 [Coccomyxa subellipsoidea C-169]|eukprot:XP_005645148.1 hypothetical protein COCSUDRAFT_57748 [Coccomyxa subellipsoidea C-169]